MNAELTAARPQTVGVMLKCDPSERRPEAYVV